MPLNDPDADISPARERKRLTLAALAGLPLAPAAIGAAQLADSVWAAVILIVGAFTAVAVWRLRQQRRSGEVTTDERARHLDLVASRWSLRCTWAALVGLTVLAWSRGGYHAAESYLNIIIILGLTYLAPSMWFQWRETASG